MIRKLCAVFLAMFVSVAIAGVDVCGGQLDVVVGHLDNDLSELKRSVEAKLLQVDTKLSESEVQAHHVETLKNELNEIEDNLWDVFNFILGLVGLTIVLGIVFTIRENTISKKALELEELQLEVRKAAIDAKIKTSLENFEEKVSSELVLFRKKLMLQEVILTGVVDEDVVYDAIRYMDLGPRFSYVVIYEKVLKLELDDELRTLVEKAQENAKKAR